MKKIIHLSDLHMCPKGEKVVGFDPAKRMRKVIDSVNLEHADAHLAIISGDLADRGDVAAYTELQILLRELSVPVHLMVGNHDNRGNFRKVFSRSHDDGNGFVQALVELDDCRLILLDTLDEAEPSSGFLCRKRLDWLKDKLDGHPVIPTIVFLHHPPFPLGDEYFRHMLLRNGDEFRSLIMENSQVRHLAFGHVHLSTSGRQDHYSFSSARGTCHPIRARLEGMVAEYVERPASYEVLLLNGENIIVHHMEVADPGALVAQEYADDDGGPGSLVVFREVD